MSVVNITTESELDGITSLHKLVAVCFRASWSAPCECLDLDGLAAATNGIAVVGQVDLDDDTDALQDTYEVAEKLPHWIVLRDGKRVSVSKSKILAIFPGSKVHFPSSMTFIFEMPFLLVQLYFLSVGVDSLQLLS